MKGQQIVKSFKKEEHKKQFLSTLSFQCQEVFGPNTKNQQIFKKAMNPLIESIRKSVSCCLVLIGSSGSGKKHTLLNSDEQKDSKGLLQMAFEEIRSFVEPDWRAKGVERLSRTISVCSICNGDVYDLIANKYTNFRIYENFQSQFHEVFSSGLTEKPVKNAKEVLGFVASSLKNFPVTSSRDRSIKKSPLFVTLKMLDESEKTNAPVYLTFLLLNSDEIWRSENLGATRDLLDYLKHITFGPERDSDLQSVYLKNKLTTVLRTSLNEDSHFSFLGTFHPKNFKAGRNTLEFMNRLKGEANGPDLKPMASRREDLDEAYHMAEEADGYSLEKEGPEELENDIDDLYYEMLGIPVDLEPKKLRETVLNFEYRGAQILERMKSRDSNEREPSSRRQRDNLEKMRKIQEMLVDLLEKANRMNMRSDSMALKPKREASFEEEPPSNLKRKFDDECQPERLRENEETLRRIKTTFGPKPILSGSRDKKKEKQSLIPLSASPRLSHSFPPSAILKKSNKRSTSTGILKKKRESSPFFDHKSAQMGSPFFKTDPRGSELLRMPQNNQIPSMESSSLLQNSSLLSPRSQLDFAKREISSLNDQILILRDREIYLMRQEEALNQEIFSLRSRISSQSNELSLVQEANLALGEKLKEFQTKRDLKEGVLSDLERALKKAKENEERALNAEEEAKKKLAQVLGEAAFRNEETLAQFKALENDNKSIFERNRELEVELQTIREKVVESRQHADETIEEVVIEKNAEILKKEEKIKKLKRKLKNEQKKSEELQKGKTQSKTEIEQNQKEKKKTEADLALLQAELAHLKQENMGMARENERLLEENREISKRHMSAMGQCGNLEKELREKSQVIQKYEQKLYDSENEIQSSLEMMTKFKRELIELREERDKLKNENNETKRELLYLEKSQSIVRFLRFFRDSPVAHHFKRLVEGNRESIKLRKKWMNFLKK